MSKVFDPDKYIVFVFPTADGYWSWVMALGGHPTLAYGDVKREKASYDDVLFGVLILASASAFLKSLRDFKMSLRS